MLANSVLSGGIMWRNFGGAIKGCVMVLHGHAAEEEMAGKRQFSTVRMGRKTAAARGLAINRADNISMA